VGLPIAIVAVFSPSEFVFGAVAAVLVMGIVKTFWLTRARKQALVCVALCVGGMVLAGGVKAGYATNSSLVSIETPRGAKQSFILLMPDHPVASVILFAGDHGALGLKSASSMNWGTGNFLVRSRDLFAADDFAVAVVDAPSDHQQGMNAVFRMSSAHAADIGAIAAYLKQQTGGPVWLVGTSMGTFSAAGAAIASKDIDGLVLTSPITRAKPDWKIAQSHRDGVASMALSQITVPTLIVSHGKDGCVASPASGAPKLSKRLTKASTVKIAILEGGDPPQSEPCEAMSPHGFLGIEAEAVKAIGAFIKANSR
jgi:pimeloyl-ACP methyl ester carboxylesterase